MPKQKRLLSTILLIALVSAGVFGVFLFDAKAGAIEYEDARAALEVMSLVRHYFVDPVEISSLVRGYVKYGTINGMLRVLNDDYTRYLDPYAFSMLQSDTTGEFGGIGIVVGIEDGEVTVVAPIENTPGFRAGLRGGDKIVEIDTKTTTNMSLDEAVSLMRGEPGTRVNLVIERGKERKRQWVPIVRDIIRVDSVTKTVMFPDKIGYIRLSNFSERTDNEVEEALTQLERQGMKALIFDLRGNPGGVLTGAIAVANKFLEDGPILHIVGRDGRKQTVSATMKGTHPLVPTVVLVDQWSASASEIVSGALKDRGVATLIGTKTFGKGLVQTVLPLRTGAALSLTTARYLTAGGNNIHKHGVEPHITLTLPEGEELPYYRDTGGKDKVDVEKDPQLKKAVEVLRSQVSSDVNLRRAG